MINGKQLRDAFISGANNISNQRQEVDALNVFPVPDGDTGTNMSMTIAAAKRELVRMSDDVTVEEVSKVAAAALLRGARGNSGVILSLLFRGFSKGLAGKKEACADDIVQAMHQGVAAAYKAVMKPTEGTILTVARMAAEHASEVAKQEKDCKVIWTELVKAAGEALDLTPEMLPVLKKAGVVDAGGKGILEIWKGMASVIIEDTITPSKAEEGAVLEKGTVTTTAELEGEITFTYCTEFIVNKSKKIPEVRLLRAHLESIGDSVVVVEDDEIIKCHVHTDNPGKALQEGLAYGSLSNMKIDNMREQFAAQNIGAEKNSTDEEFAYVPVDPQQKYGFVSIAAGDGVKQLFLDLGVHNVVSGGQTMNPSTDDILKAIHATPARHVFVLPNNKNIIMAAEQTISLADRKVHVLQTRTIPQGLSAMLAFDPDEDSKTNVINMTKTFDKVGTGLITFAARDSDYENHAIKKGELLALENGKLAFTEKDLTKAVVKLTAQLVKKSQSKDNSFITLIYGEDIAPETAQTVEAAVRAKLHNDVELAVISGGQPVYYFMISVE